LGFSVWQKRVFLLAVRGCSNASIAARLDISEESVRSCFRTGYEKVRAHPVFGVQLEDEARAGKEKALSRKRHKFIEILQTHIEELRPWSAKPVLERKSGTFFPGSNRIHP
jgi:hypothetical protein